MGGSGPRGAPADWGSGPVGGSGDWELPPIGEVEDTLGVADPARYGDPTTLGVGGMGRVEAVRDGRLGREVARKTLRSELRDDPAGRARFLREVRITARLDHPGIVPIFDAGRDADGAPWFTMRLIRGRSLEELLTTSDLPGRLALVSRFLAACQAVAYAHANGVVHRDLKPSNIMIGPFGETQVVDWGLARELDTQTDDLAVRTLTTEGTCGGGVLGSPGWMSPEQTRGKSADRASDVYSLGLVLRALLVGRSPPDGPVDAAAPPELLAIVARATAHEPADRYPDAAALAEDVGAWLEGRRVSAYVYPTWELARRLARAWRAPLAVGALASVALAGAVAVGWIRTSAERDRAIEAEAEMRRVLVSDLVRDGHAALREGDLGAAATAAATALELADHPGARGIVAALDAYGPSPRLLSDAPAPSCERIALDPLGRSLVCAGPQGLALWDVGSGEERWRVPSDAADVARPTPNGPVVASTLAALTLHDPDTGAVIETVRPGAGRRLLRAAPGPAVVDSSRLWRVGEADLDCGLPVQVFDAGWRDGVWAMACTDWSLRLVGEQERRFPVLEPPKAGMMSVAFLDGSTALAGSMDGDVVAIDLTSGAILARARVGSGPIRKILPSPDGRLIAVSGERTAVRLLAAPSLIAVAGLPDKASELAWDADGALITVSERVRRWSFDGAVRWGVVAGSGGLDGAALGLDGVVTLHEGSGDVLAVAPDGRVRARLHWQDGVVKQGEHAGVTFAAVGMYALGVRRWDERTWQPLPTLGAHYFRDFAALHDGGYVGAPFDVGLVRLWADGSHATLLDGMNVREVAADEAGQTVIAVADPAGLALLVEDKEIWWDAEFRGRAAISADGSTIWTVHDGALVQRDARDGSVTAELRAPQQATAIAASRDGSQVGVGYLDGAVRIWAADGTLLAVVDAHAERVAEIRALDDGWLTASWDGTARRLRAAPLVAPREELRERLAGRLSGG